MSDDDLTTFLIDAGAVPAGLDHTAIEQLPVWVASHPLRNLGRLPVPSHVLHATLATSMRSSTQLLPVSRSTRPVLLPTSRSFGRYQYSPTVIDAMIGLSTFLVGTMVIPPSLSGTSTTMVYGLPLPTWA